MTVEQSQTLTDNGDFNLGFESQKPVMEFDFDVLARIQKEMADAQISATAVRSEGRILDISHVARRSLPVGIEILQRDVQRLWNAGPNVSKPFVNEHIRRLKELRTWMELAQPMRPAEIQSSEAKLIALEAKINTIRTSAREITPNVNNKVNGADVGKPKRRSQPKTG